MKQENLSILFFIAKKRLLKNGEAPVFVRVTINGIDEEIRIQRSIPAHLWNQAKGRSKGKDSVSMELNDYINQLNVKLCNLHKKLVINEAYISPKSLLSNLFGQTEAKEDKKNVLGYFRSHADDCRKLIGIDYAYSTINRYDNCIKSLENVILQEYDKDDISFNELNPEFIRKFELYLKTEKGLANNTLVRYMKAFKKVTNLALADDYLKKDPFTNIRYKQDETNPTFLTLEELQAIQNKEFGTERLNLVKNLFLFSSYTGLAFIDAKELKPEHLFRDNNGKLWIRKGREKIKRNKAACTSNIPLLEVAQGILDRYRGNPLCVAKGACLPMLSNQKMNSYLKEIADFCGIKKNLSTHVSRHRISSFPLKTSKLQNNFCRQVTI